jgi:AhpD family alkylhydroperoxidase
MSQPSSVDYPAKRNALKQQLPKLAAGQAEVMKGFSSLHKAAVADGALSTKTKELIALAIAVSARCDGCIAFHTHDALKAGATSEEVMDALGVAILMGGGPSMVYAAQATEALAQFAEPGGS